ncbi:MAG: hypothetical protein IJT60_06195 [Clostridia bacterium]|nr:hypothetical protein [Clostridia bacterium]
MTTLVKSTVNLNRNYKEQLELFVRMNRISSVTEGINAALEAYVKDTQKAMYEEQMAEAAKDRAFMERTIGSQSEFERIDHEGLQLEDEEW